MNKTFLFILITITFIPSCSRKIKGTGKSKSVGSVSNGSLKNGRKMPFKGKIIVSFLKLVMGH